MLHDRAMQLAKKIASLLIIGAQNVGGTPAVSQSLFGSLAIDMAASARDLSALDPRIKEILIFGSTAKGGDEVGDLDMFVFDGGFYSNVLMSLNKNGDLYGCRDMDMYSSIGKNLRLLLEGFMGYRDTDPQFSEVLNIDTDLHVLPISLLTDPDKRRKIAARHIDDCFFENAFSHLLRFNADTLEFEPVTIEALEQKYAQAESLVA